MLTIGILGILPAIDAPANESTSKVSLTQEEDGITVLIDGKLFTRYLIQSGPRPVLWPIIGPTGKEMTRAYPVSDDREGEEKDHIHHRSMWIGYEGLNGNDFWHEYEADRTRPFALGKTKHREFSKVESNGSTASIESKNDWLGGNGEIVCSDTRILQFGSDGDQRWIDFHFVLTASAGPLEIGDSKEGVFALRVAPTMRVDAGLGGRIVSSTGMTDAEAWAQPAKWVDYSGPIDGETVGIAILAHPSSFAPIPRWHVRTYGLFAANPFGELAFTDPESDVTKRPLKRTLAKGESLTMSVRVIFHRGDEIQARIANQYEEYSAQRR